MALPTNTRVLYYNPEAKCFQQDAVPESWCVHVSDEYRWHFSDMDSDGDIYLDPNSAMEVEAGYQAWRRYLKQMFNPHGEEGTVPDKPPKEVHVRQGWYTGKDYRVSYETVAASRASTNAIERRHIEVYQQNSTTGFMRTLVRSPVDSVAKPYSGLQVDAKIETSEGGLKIQIDAAAGRSFFGYQYDRTVFVFTFGDSEHDLATRIIHCCEDQELFRLEVPRSHQIFPPVGSRRAMLIMKQSIEEFGIKRKHWKRHVILDEEKNGKLVQNPELCLHEKQMGIRESIEGEPDVSDFDLSEEKETDGNANENLLRDISDGNVSRPSKFDLYSYIRNCPCGGRPDTNCQHRVLFNRFNVDQDNQREYEEHHFGRVVLNGAGIEMEEVQQYVRQMACWRGGDLAFMMLNDMGNVEFEEIGNATAICKDAVYNRFLSSVRSTPQVMIVTVRASRAFTKEFGEDGPGVEEECEFVTFLGFNGKIASLSDGEWSEKCYRI